MNVNCQSSANGPADNDQSYFLPSLESRVSEIIETTMAELPVRTNLFNEEIIKQLALIIASELRLNAETSKVLSFILCREQAPSNCRPCIPTGSTSNAIYTDVLESCIQNHDPSIYKHMLAIGIDRYVVWILLQVFMSGTLPLVLRVRFLDLMLIQGCVHSYLPCWRT
ncbi:5'-nucleotidase activity protein [Phytophthora oleae]|uniref:5'-nucleotidase activity protein n=1 Tax=Phytophthora oleae TaxID=2107226 RepID=A0ABD3G3T6_9STRA